MFQRRRTMSSVEQRQVFFSTTDNSCPIGEKTGKEYFSEAKIPVLSCEGACIRGEIARLAANIIAKGDAYGRGCHGELITVPQSAIARWTASAEKVVLIDGCFLRCHGRILENLIDPDKLIQFDALSHYKKYTDIFDYEDVPEEERKEVAQSVAAWVKDCLECSSTTSTSSCTETESSCSACSA
jgi:uncharacterized metal-binding protein